MGQQFFNLQSIRINQEWAKKMNMIDATEAIGTNLQLKSILNKNLDLTNLEKLFCLQYNVQNFKYKYFEIYEIGCNLLEHGLQY